MDHLIQALNLTINPQNQNDIKQGEAFLEQNKLQQGFCINLMQIASNNQYPFNLRQAAIVQLKLTVEKYWQTRNPTPQSQLINEIDKQAIKDNVLEALIQVVDTPKIAINYEKIINHIAQYDFPKDWNDVISKIFQKIQQANTFEEFHGAIVMFKNIISNYEFLIDVERKPLEVLIQNSFPTLEVAAQNILNKYNDTMATTFNEILKIFFCATHLSLPDYFRQFQNLKTWMIYIKTILDAPVPAELETPTQNEEEGRLREKNIHWKNKKQCGKILQRFIQKYGNKKALLNDDIGIADEFQSNYALPFLESFTTLLFKKNSNFVSKKTLHFSLKYVFYALRIDVTFNQLHPHLEKIFFDVALPMCHLTEQDNKIWNEDPEEYIRKEEDFTVTNNNNKNTAMDLIEAICKKTDPQGQKYILKFIQYANICMSTGVDPRTNQSVDILQREALLWAFGQLKEDIIAIKGFEDQIEMILQKHVLPEFKNQIGFLRARACFVFAKYGHINFKNIENIKLAVEGISQCLMDNQLPVKVKAAIALNCLLQQQAAEDLLRPSLPQLLEIYIKLMDQIDNEGVIAALEGIVQQYQNEVVPFAYELTNHLCKAFHKYCKKQTDLVNKDDDDDMDEVEELEMTAAGCLEAIRKIFMAPLPQETYQKLEELFLPTFNYVLSEDGSDYIEEGVSCFNLLLYKQNNISSYLWIYYPVLCYLITGIPQGQNIAQILPNLNEDTVQLIEYVKDGWGQEHIELLIGSFKNFIGKGGANFLQQNDWLGNNFVNLLFNVIARIYQTGVNGQDDYDMICVTSLYIALIENNIGRIDYLIPTIVDNCYKNIFNLNRSDNFKVINIEVISIALYYNPKLTLNCLEQNNQLIAFFQGWFQLIPKFRQEFDKARMLLGLSAILSLNEHEIPQSIQNSLQQLVKEMVKLTTQILELREKEETIDENDEAEEDDKLKQGDKQEDDEDDDDEEFDDFEQFELSKSNQYYNSPLEEIDEILFFRSVLEKNQQAQPQFYGKLTSYLDQQEQQKLSENFKNAQDQYEQWKLNQNSQQQK